MRIIYWNSFGAKWDNMYTFYLRKELKVQADDVIGLLVEAGWPPWMAGGVPVALDNIYGRDEESDRYDEQSALLSAACEAARLNRSSKLWWIPWVKKLADLEKGITSNSRCSLGALVFPRKGSGLVMGTATRIRDAALVRPVLSIPILVRRDVVATLYLVHLVSNKSNNPTRALKELDYLTKTINLLTPAGQMAFVVGDFNIDLLAVDVSQHLPDHWEVLACNPKVATQQKGGMLDWALIYNPEKVDLTTDADVLRTFKTGVNTSDHSVMMFDITWSWT